MTVRSSWEPGSHRADRQGGPLRRAFARLTERFAVLDANIKQRLRIAAWAIAIGAVAGAIELPLPAEDAYRALRAEIRSRPVPQDIVVVAIDDKTLNELGVDEPDRRDDAKLLDILFAAGAKRVFFDKAYADPTTPEADAAFEAALKRHWPNVYLGGSPKIREFGRNHDELKPIKQFRLAAKLASFYGELSPFALAARFPADSQIAGQKRSSISAQLADFESNNYWYRVDMAWQLESIPTVSYVDVLANNINFGARSRVDVVIAPTHMRSSDLKPLPFGGYTAGVNYHVIGAHTLKAGPPVDVSWLVVLLTTTTLIIVSIILIKIEREILTTVFCLLLTMPLLLDELSYSAEILPALICLCIYTVRLQLSRLRSIDRRSGLLNVDELRNHSLEATCDVLAFKFCNLAEVAANSSDQKVSYILSSLTHRLRSTEVDAQFAFSKDTLIWLRPKLEPSDLREHLRGMQALTQIGLEVEGHTVEVRAAIGADVNRHSALRERIENAIQCAEDAAHKGEACIIADTAHLEERALRLGLLSDLDKALQDGQVALAYQPKICLATRRIVGAEALLRWHHPEKGYIDPERLVAMAEAHGRIDELTLYALTHALREAKALRLYDPLFTIAVNVSPVSLRSVLFLYNLNRLFERFAFAPQFLTIEVTENCPIDHEVTADVLRALRQQRVNISIDDFGTGQATFSYLKEIPGGEVKIDRSFITNLITSPSDQAIVRAAIEMADKLGRIVVAEGVETQEVAQLLREMGCHQAQGYLYSPAVPASKLLAMMREQKVA